MLTWAAWPVSPCFLRYTLILICPSSTRLLSSRQTALLFSVTKRQTKRPLGEKKKKVQKRFSRSPSSAPAAFYGEFERKPEKRLPRTHSSALPFHPLASFSFKRFFIRPGFSRLQTRMWGNAYTQDTRANIAEHVWITGRKKVGCVLDILPKSQKNCRLLKAKLNALLGAEAMQECIWRRFYFFFPFILLYIFFFPAPNYQISWKHNILS